MAPASRKELKKAMLAIFMESNKAGKKKRSTEFTKLLFEFVEEKMKGKKEEEVQMKQMEAVGLFSQYIFRKNTEKGKEKGKSNNEILEEISRESDELYDEIEACIQ